MNSLLRWAGSKRQILPALASYWNARFDRYFEPFCGSSALFFHLAPSRAVLSDLNSELIDFYATLRERPAAVWKAACELPRTKRVYLALRSKDPARMNADNRAARFLYLNRNCFNGLYRTNRSGQFNVPYAPLKAGEIPGLRTVIDAADLLRNARLRAQDFGTSIRNASSGDFVYMDPPFFVSSRRVFRDYGARKFCAPDVKRLSRHLDRLHGRGASFLVSFADCAESRSIAENWSSRRVRVRRHIAGFAGDRRFSYELLISNGTVPQGEA
jgi:DNA adenine methylase